MRDCPAIQVATQKASRGTTYFFALLNQMLTAVAIKREIGVFLMFPVKKQTACCVFA